jgi:hypothetical protein
MKPSRRVQRHRWDCGDEYSNLPQRSQARNQQARENVQIRGRKSVEVASSLTDSDGTCDESRVSCGHGEAGDSDSCSGTAERWSEGEEQVKPIDEIEYGDDELDPDERELSGRVMLPVKVGNTKLNAKLDTAAQSVWVSHVWYRGHFGEPDSDSSGAFGADSSALDVTGGGKVTFSIWGRVFHDQEVRVLRGLDVDMLIGLKFQREHEFVLDIGRMHASFVVNGYQFHGKLNDGAVLDTGEEALHAVVEDSNVDQAIHELGLNVFSDAVAMQEKFRRVIWERRAVFKGLGLVRGMTHVIDVKPDA